MSEPMHYPGAPIPIPATPPEVHGVLCDVCGQEIAGTQKIVPIPGIGVMHDTIEVPGCKLRPRPGMQPLYWDVKPSTAHLVQNTQGDELLVTLDEQKAQAFVAEMNAKHGEGWCSYDDFVVDKPVDGWWLR